MMNNFSFFNTSLTEEILTVEHQLNGISLEHKVQQLDSPNRKDNYDSYFMDADLPQDNQDLWEYSNDYCNGNIISDNVITELQQDEVRWFYKSYSNKRWIEFCGYDSLNIENKYKLYLQDEECKDNVNNGVSNGTTNGVSNRTTNGFTNGSNGVSPESKELKPNIDLDKYSIVVRGGLYEVVLAEKQCISIYWPGEQCVVTRGSWFYENGQPCEVDLSDRVEQIHLSLYEGHKSSEYKIEVKNGGRPAVRHTENFSDSTVMWYSPDEVYLYSQATPSKIVRSISQKLGSYFQKSTGYKLVRSYKVPAVETDRPEDISHLVFVVHGMGQKMDSGRIIKNATQCRESVTWLKNKYFPSSKLRAEFFPVEWRNDLSLDGDIVEAITPLNVLNLRHLLNSSAMDIMYYTSPIYGSEIQQGLTDELNRLYSMFLARNPNHKAKVSIIAHSLGCVIVYDAITGWIPQMYQQESGVNSHNHSNCKGNQIETTSRLNFHLDNLFCLGSPLAVFLALRVPKGHHGNHLFPPSLCTRLYNIFHPSDPVAYRLEPLVVKNYSKIAPLTIHSYNASSKILYCDMPLEFIIPSSESREDTSNVSPADTPCKDKSWKLWNLSKPWSKFMDGSNQPAQVESPYEGLEHRLDYVVKDTYGGTTRGYLSAVTSHTAYWSNYDVSHFILTRLFPELEKNMSPAENTSAQESSFISL